MTIFTSKYYYLIQWNIAYNQKCHVPEIFCFFSHHFYPSWKHTAKRASIILSLTTNINTTILSLCMFIWINWSTHFWTINTCAFSYSWQPYQSSLYLLQTAPKNLQPKPIYLISCKWTTSTSLTPHTFTSLLVLPVKVSTLQVPVLKIQHSSLYAVYQTCHLHKHNALPLHSIVLQSIWGLLSGSPSYRHVGASTPLL